MGGREPTLKTQRERGVWGLSIQSYAHCFLVLPQTVSRYVGTSHSESVWLRGIAITSLLLGGARSVGINVTPNKPLFINGF